MAKSNSTYKPITASLSARGEKLLSMDPKLQQAIVLRRSGAKKKSTSSTVENELAVIAIVSDVEAWGQLTEVRAPIVITKTSADGQTIVTGRIPIRRIEHIRSMPFVKSLKAARRLSRTVRFTVPDIGADRFSPGGGSGTGGEGVVVGIVDFGCDFAHENFLTPDGNTRVLQLWDQTAVGIANGVPYGVLHEAEEMDSVLSADDPYEALRYFLEEEAHGTHVMDIATGNGLGSGEPGVAPAADIIFVEPSTSSIPWSGREVLGKSFGDSVNLLEAVKYIFDQAGNRPCVINISLGTNGGPHDGTTLVEKGIDGMLEEMPNRAVVIAASNSHEDGIHAAGSVPASGSSDLEWIVADNDETENEMEIWFKDGQLSVEIIDPAQNSLGVVDPDETGEVQDDNGTVQLVISNRLNDPNNGHNVIEIWMKENNRGRWKVRLINKGNTSVVDFHAWIERDDEGQSSFGGTLDNSHTLGSISCSHKAITVGSYDATKSSFPISFFSSEGPTRDGRQKPEIAAPGTNVRAAASRSGTGSIRMSGTSMAAPAVTGSIALLYAAAQARGKSLSIDELRDIITKKGGRLNPPVSAWDARFGFGRIFVPEMIAMLGGTILNGMRSATKRAVAGKKESREALVNARKVALKAEKKAALNVAKKVARKAVEKAMIRALAEVIAANGSNGNNGNLTFGGGSRDGSGLKPAAPKATTSKRSKRVAP